MTLYFQSSNGQRREIGYYTTQKYIFKAINAFLDEHNYKSYYTRIWRQGNEVWFDVGSHTEFFVLIDKDNKFGVE